MDYHTWIESNEWVWNRIGKYWYKIWEIGELMNILYAFIVGKKVVDTYNRGRDDDSELIRFVCHITAGEWMLIATE